MKNKKLVFIVIFIVSTILLIYEMIVLPNMVVVKIDARGQSVNQYPKVLAIAIPYLISLIPSILQLKGKNDMEFFKNLFISLIGIAGAILNLIFNL